LQQLTNSIAGVLATPCAELTLTVVMLGVCWLQAVVIAAALSMSSSAFVLQLLSERGESATRTGSATLGILLFQVRHRDRQQQQQQQCSCVYMLLGRCCASCVQLRVR
jgi:hypothetical protein